ncbi:hypothetical protein P167DRAFT_563424 [Morchella conica CCBAS932]|uniref:Extracellular membrane protein CFEM domain-containing protein n=1 Tax=Morchella conica CCBAS932 TaxID=1392247 RepID=A0A3N4KX44_9PEZI|nr:hypothetical protein P167DRAFT_563424 [Morchella conica CCBAS932]
MHYPSVTFILPVALSLVGSVAAFAMPSPQDFSSSSCNQCLALASTADTCGWSITSTDVPTISQTTCMCGLDSFIENYKDCMSCMVTTGVMNASDAATYSTAVVDGCSTLTGGGTSTSGSGSGTSTRTSTGSSSSSTSSSSGGSTSTDTGTSSGSSNSNGNDVLDQSGAGALSAGSGQFVLGAVAAVGVALYAL